jgi:hypothetical protein
MSTYYPTASINSTSSYALVSASASSTSNGARPVPTITQGPGTFGSCVWHGFSNTVTTTDSTLWVNVQTSGPDPADLAGTFTVTISAEISGTSTTIATVTSPQTQITPYSVDVPSGTNLSTVSITVNVTAHGSATQASSFVASCKVFSILAG